MTFSSLLLLVLIAVIVLSLLFVFFHVFIILLPVALVAFMVIWLIYHFSGRKNNHSLSSNDWFNQSSFYRDINERPRKKARNVKTKDVNDDRQ